MYHHFSGKADLARAAIEQLAGDLERETEQALADLPPLERVLAYLDRERDPLRGCRVGRLTADADVIGDAVLREPVAASLARLQANLAEALPSSTPRSTRRTSPRRSSPSSRAATCSPAPSRTPEPFERAIRGARALVLNAVKP